MAGIIAVILELAQVVPAFISLITAIVSLFHKNVPTGSRVDAVKNMTAAVQKVNDTGNTDDLHIQISSIAKMPDMVPQ